MHKINIAIIGGGLSSITFLESFIQEFTPIQQSKKFYVTLFEKKEEVGVGLAYQHDLDNLLLNTPIEKMFINEKDLEDFQIWFEQYSALQEEKIQKTEYISRKVFGYYIKDRLNKNITVAQSLGIHVNIIQKSVVNIRDLILLREIETSDGEKYNADFIILCTGHNQSKDIYQLSNTPRYINSPYPVYKKFSDIQKTDSVGVIGSGLTGIDIAISLKKLGVTGHISLLSRRHVYPYVRSQPNHHEMKFFTPQEIQRIKNEKGTLTLKDSLKLFKKELKSIDNLSWKFFFKEQDRHVSFSDILFQEIEQAEKIRPWQGLLMSTNSVVEEWWNLLDEHSKRIFMKHFHRIWLNKRVPIPANNAKILLEMAEKNQLEMLSGLKSIHYDEEQKQYVVHTQFGEKTGEKKYYDWIINATGPSRDVQPTDTFLQQLIENKLARKNPYGGLDVDFETSALMGENGRANPFIRVLGHNTAGTYYFVSSVEMIAQKAVKIAKHIADSIQSMPVMELAA